MQCRGAARLGASARVVGSQVRTLRSELRHNSYRTLATGPTPPSARYVLRKVQPPSAAPYLQFEDSVLRALTEGTPVVALESTIISHGMPYPQNVETALQVESIVRSEGATPATIALIGGKLHIGLSPDKLELLGKTGPAAKKCSRRDLASVLASRGVGATTVAGTMIAAELAGIRLFVTGGIGGVHRGVADTWDISADLTELGQTPVTVVCAGVKSILDISKTLEYLETQGVPVLTYKSSEFPAFFSPHSGIKATERVDSTTAIARHMLVHKHLGLQHGTVVAVPNPSPAEGAAIQAAIDTALAELQSQRISGRDATPFLLKRVNELTGGESLKANIALVKNNAKVGAQIAREYVRLQQAPASKSEGGGASSPPAPASQAAPAKRAPRAASIKAAPSTGAVSKRGFSTVAAPVSASAPRHPSGVAATGRVVVTGGAVVDLLMRPTAGKKLIARTSNPGTITQSFGGVARNVAEVIGRLGSVQPLLLTVLGHDGLASGLLAHTAAAGVRVFTPTTVTAPSSSSSAAVSTPTYAAVLDGDGDMTVAVADMAAFTALTPQALSTITEATAAPAAGTLTLPQLLQSAALVVMDANFSADVQSAVARACAAAAVPLVFEPISVAKSVRILGSAPAASSLHLVTVCKPNEHEVRALAAGIREQLGLPAIPAEEPEPAAPPAAASSAGGKKQAAAQSSTVIDIQPGNRAAGQAPQAVKSTESADTDAADAGEASPVDYSLLTAAQTVLAAMIRPQPLAVPVSTAAKAVATGGAGSAQGVAALEHAVPGWQAAMSAASGAATPEAAVHAVAAALDAAAKQQAKSATTQSVGSAAVTIEDRKHLLVSLGAAGVLWLSAPPAPSTELADLAMTLPFFVAARHPALNIDFKLCPPPPAAVQKATGAGDTLVGCLSWALARGAGMAEALEVGLAGAKLALEAPPEGGAVPQTLTSKALEAVLPSVPKVDDEYA